MFFLFNWGSGAEDLGPVQVRACTNCHNTADWHLLHHRTRIGLFFVNLITVRSRYTVSCSICGNHEEISGERAETMRRMFRGGGG